MVAHSMEARIEKRYRIDQVNGSAMRASSKVSSSKVSPWIREALERRMASHVMAMTCSPFGNGERG